jgi:hypothetical protein
MIGSHNDTSTPDHGLHAGPAIQDARIAPHPAIATSADPSSYDPARAVGIEKARGFATGHVTRRASTGQTSEVSKRTQAEIAKRLDRRVARANRTASIEAFERGELSIEAATARHSLTHRQFLVWVYDERRRPYKPFKEVGPPEPKPPRVRNIDDGLLIGAGGHMTDPAVRKATLRLEERITALQHRQNLPTFAYRKTL